MIAGGIARAIARPIISSLVKKGLGPKAIVSQLRAIGPQYRYQTMLNDIREFTHFHKQWGWTTRINQFNPSPIDTIPSITLRQPYKFRTYFKVEKTNIYTGEKTDEIISNYFDDHLSPDQWTSDTLDDISEDPTDPTVTITSISMVDAVKNEALF